MLWSYMDFDDFLSCATLSESPASQLRARLPGLAVIYVHVFCAVVC